MGLEYYSFDNVLGELNMDEDELKRLVSEGQIRAFRDENRMKFRKDDIDSLKRGKQTEPTIILPDGALDAHEPGGSDELFVVESENEETLLDLENFDSDLGTDESSVPSLDFDEDTGGGVETLTEELVFDEDEDLGGTDEMTMGDDFDDFGSEATQRIDDEAAFLDDDELGMQTEPLSIEVDDDDDGDADATFVEEDFTAAGDEEDEDEEEEEDEDFDDGEATVVSAPAPKKAAAGRAAAPARRAPAAAAAPAARAEPAAAAAPPMSKPVNIGWVIALGLTFVIMALGALTMYDYSTNSFTGVSKTIGEQAAVNILGQKEWQATDYRPNPHVQFPSWLNPDPESSADAIGQGSGDPGSGGLE